MLVTRSLTLFWPLLALVYGVGAVDLYPFESHVQLPPGNEEMETVDLTTPFIFFQQEYTQIAVNATLHLVYCGLHPNDNEAVKGYTYWLIIEIIMLSKRTCIYYCHYM